MRPLRSNLPLSSSHSLGSLWLHKRYAAEQSRGWGMDDLDCARFLDRMSAGAADGRPYDWNRVKLLAETAIAILDRSGEGSSRAAIGLSTALSAIEAELSPSHPALQAGCDPAAACS